MENISQRNIEDKFLIGQMADDLVDMTITMVATSHQGWRAHALQGENCHRLVEAWDSWLCCELKKLGYELIIKDRRVRSNAYTNTCRFRPRHNSKNL